MTDTSHNILKRLGSTPFPDDLQQIADDAGEHIQAQDETIKALVDALGGVIQFFAMPHENATERFDRLAERYLRETAKWAPGKSIPDAYNDSTDCETRRKDYDAWVQSKVDAGCAALAAAKETT